MSLASTASVNEKVSSGEPVTASGLEGLPGVPSAVFAGCQLWVIVSGLNWKLMTFGSGSGNVSLNSMRAPRRYLLGMARLSGSASGARQGPARRAGRAQPRRR